MNRRTIGCLLRGAACMAVLALFVLPPLPAGAVDDEPLIFVDESLSPLTIGELGREAEGGMSLVLLEEVLGRLGLGVRLKLMPFARALKTVEAGQADGIPLLMKTAERELFMCYTDEVIRDRECFYYLPALLGPFGWDGFESLQGLVVGIVHGYTYGEAFMRAVGEGKVAVEYAPDSEANLRKLLAGRVDLALEGEFQFMAVTSTNPRWRSAIRRVLPEVTSYALYIGLSRSRPGTAALVPAINEALRDMRDDGTLERIFGGGGE